jgi:DNA repair protein RadA/Sms
MTKSRFICQQCGYSQVGWAGKCPECGSWGSLIETVVSKAKIKNKKAKRAVKPVNLSSIKSVKTSRVSTKITELDRVLGGGLVKGQVVLLAGEPGIGKSTLLLQVADKLKNVLYVSGEESVRQLAIRAQRLGVREKTIQLLEETDVDSVISLIEQLTSNNQALKAIIIDSIQAMSTSDLSGMTGSVGQVRECAYRLIKLAKAKNIPMFLVGHITKEGSVAGPAVLAHMVDSVLWFEGDKSLTLRLLRAVKNRFGPTDEIGIFMMKDKGLICVTNPEKTFLTKGRKNIAGSAISSLMQGTRPILVEIQSLVVPSKLAFPKRIAQGIDSRRFELLIAVLTRRCGLPLYEYDCYIKVTGGIKTKEPGIDLAICLSLASAFFDKPLSKKTLVIGEVGLLGEIREVVAYEKRVKQAKRLGFNQIISYQNARYLQQAIKTYLR